MTTQDLADPALFATGIPHPLFRELRANTPVAWQPSGFWAITRYRDVVTVLKTPRTFSSWRGGALLADPPPAFLAKLREGMLNRDPPDHTALRRLVNKAFSPRQIERLDQRIAAHARELVAAAPEGEVFDLARTIAGEMTLFVICEILGVPLADRAALYGLTERMFGSTIVDPKLALADGMAAAEELRSYAAELGRAKRATPTEDILSDLLDAELDGRRLTDGEFQAFFQLLFNAGADTTRGLLCFGVDLLLDHQDQLARLRADDRLLAPAIEEMLRYEPPVIQFRRTAMHDVELAGTQIREGDKVVVYFPSANRDEEVFPDPDRFDIARTPNDHLAFGYGTHFCLGAPLARSEARHVLAALLARFGRLERVAPIELARTNFIRTVRSLRIRGEVR